MSINSMFRSAGLRLGLVTPTRTEKAAAWLDRNALSVVVASAVVTTALEHKLQSMRDERQQEAFQGQLDTLALRLEANGEACLVEKTKAVIEANERAIRHAEARAIDRDSLILKGITALQKGLDDVADGASELHEAFMSQFGAATATAAQDEATSATAPVTRDLAPNEVVAS